MKALLLKGPGRLELVELPRPPLEPGQVRLRVRRVGICGSDYKSIAGKLPFTRFPIVPGHEASGEVLESCADAWRPGDRVLLHPILCAREDPAFRRGAVHHSETTEVLGVVSRHGAYAEEVVVEDYMLRRTPEGMDEESAAMVEPVAVAVRACRRGGLQPGERVLAFGAGNIGLLVIQAARALGASFVAVTDPVAAKLALARRLGADEALDPRQGLPPGYAGRFDLVIDGVGDERSVADGLAACARGGRIVVYGVPPGEIRFPLKAAFAKDAALLTCRLYDADFQTAIALVAEGRVRVKDLITHRVRLEDAPPLIERILAGQEQAIKVMMEL
jgi:L-iditol 2-dehydrogenase